MNCPKCNHLMKETMLFTSTVYDCSCETKPVIVDESVTLSSTKREKPKLEVGDIVKFIKYTDDDGKDWSWIEGFAKLGDIFIVDKYNWLNPTALGQRGIAYSDEHTELFEIIKKGEKHV